MAFERNMEFSDAQSLASKSSGVSTKSTHIDYMARSNYNAWGSAQNPQIGGMCVTVQVHTLLVGAGATIIPKLVTKASASISSGATVVATLPTIAAVAVPGTKSSVILPPGTERLAYLGMLYTVSGAKLTSAKLNAQLRPYPSQVID